MLSVVMLSVVMLSVIMQSVVVLNVLMQSVVVLIVVMLSVVAPHQMIGRQDWLQSYTLGFVLQQPYKTRVQCQTL
jgi:hypothetical protein